MHSVTSDWFVAYENDTMNWGCNRDISSCIVFTIMLNRNGILFYFYVSVLAAFEYDINLATAAHHYLTSFWRISCLVLTCVELVILVLLPSKCKIQGWLSVVEINTIFNLFQGRNLFHQFITASLMAITSINKGLTIIET